MDHKQLSSYNYDNIGGCIIYTKKSGSYCTLNVHNYQVVGWSIGCEGVGTRQVDKKKRESGCK